MKRDDEMFYAVTGETVTPLICDTVAGAKNKLAKVAGDVIVMRDKEHLARRDDGVWTALQ